MIIDNKEESKGNPKEKNITISDEALYRDHGLGLDTGSY